MSNCERFAAVPIAGGGTSTQEWLAAVRLPPLDLDDCPGLVIVSAHPDDETLGLGGAAASLAERGVEVEIISVSDGGGAYPDLSAFDRIHLGRARHRELCRAAGILGVRQPIRLGLPDGAIADHEDVLIELLTLLLQDRPGVWCATTWRGDGHPDHEAVGRCAAVAAELTGAVLIEYPLWMWHWARPGDPAVPWSRAYSVPHSRSAAGRKGHAVACFQSQLVSATPDSPPVLPDFVLRRLLAVGEVVFR